MILASAGHCRNLPITTLGDDGVRDFTGNCVKTIHIVSITFLSAYREKINVSLNSLTLKTYSLTLNLNC